jgi:hypothetical protein
MLELIIFSVRKFLRTNIKLDLFDIYSDYLISQNHYATSTGLASMFQGEINHDQITRHLRSKDYSSLN